MESKRAILAVVLSLLVLILWTQLFSPKKSTEPVIKEQKQEAIKGGEEKKIKENLAQEEEKKTTVEKTVTVEDKQNKQQQEVDSKNARVVEIRSRVGIYRFSEIGGKLISLKLIGMKETTDPGSELKELIKVQEGTGTLELITKDNSIGNLSRAVYKAETDSYNIDATNAEKRIEFKWTSASGVEVKKIFTIKPDDFLFDMEIVAINNSNKTIDDNIGIVLSAKRNTDEGGNYAFRGFGAYVDGKLKELDLGDIKKQEGVVAGKISWGGYENSYFLQAVLPTGEKGDPQNGSLKAEVKRGQEEIKNPEIKITYLAMPQKIGPGEKSITQFKVFFGPKRIELLNKAGYNLDKSINMGWFDIVAKPFLYFLNFTYGMVKNFGLSIIILTIVVKLVFWPLTQKSYKSMKAMQTLQPQMMKLREKYKSDKQKLNQEMMGLYKAHKVNPMGGCLPMVIQIPVFIALYRLLDYAIELRHTPFMWWIQDLSAPDRLFRFPFSIPLMEPPYGIPVLTLLMGASMFITQKMTPTPGDPTQAKIMLLMPIVFTFIFINFPSGLVLYWLTQNILSIGQQYWVNKKK